MVPFTFARLRTFLTKANMSSTIHAEDSLSDFRTDSRVLVLSVMAVFIGSISAVVAKILLWLIAVITNLAYFHRFSSEASIPGEHHLGYWSVLVPVVGAIIIGLMARYGSPKIRGHGIPEALEAILIGGSRVEPKVAVLKPLSSAISIGTGGPFGAEGPIIMTGGACGSLFAQFFHLTSAERKTLLVAGAAAGMSAIFATPVAAVLLAVELLLFEWKPRSFIPVAIASTVAVVLRVKLLGPVGIFPVTPHADLGAQVMGFAFALGIVSGLVSGLMSNMVYGVEDFFSKFRIHWMWWPAIGAVFVGLGGLVEPRVLGVGYETIHGLLRGDLVGNMVIGLVVAKALVWAVALGSGTSGGVLAPLLIIGGALGAICGQWIPVGDASLWAMIGMAAMMGGTMRAPFTATVFAVELTHDLNALPALLIGCVAAVGVTVLLLRRSILTEKIARRGLHISCEYSVDILQSFRVSEVMSKEPPVVPVTMKVSELSERIAMRDERLTRRQGTIIVDADGRLAGMITRADLLRALQQKEGGNLTVLEAGKRDPIVAYADELLHDAVARMLKNNVGRLPVVNRQDPMKPVGYLGRADILEARIKHHDEENIREKSRDLFAPAGSGA